MTLMHATRLVGFLTLVAATLFSAGVASGQDPVELQAKVDKLAKPIVEEGRSVGIAVGVLKESGETQFFSYGRLAKCNPAVPDAETIFELGSVTKCFTGTLLARMVEAGEVRLQEPAMEYLPRGVELPRVSNRPITLEELATYSSGLPRMPNNIGPTPRDFAQYSPERMFEFLTGLARREVGRSPERHYLYSNHGFALLGQCLGRRADVAPRTLIRERICLELGMRDTVFEPSERQEARVAHVHDKEGRQVAPWETGCIAPAGMLRSTTRDMVRFIEANVGKIETPLAPALQLAQRSRYETGAEAGKKNLKIGLAWFIDPETGFVQHNGSTRGSSANVVFDPKRKIGVVVLMNQNSAPSVRLSLQVMHLLHGKFDIDRVAVHRDEEVDPMEQDKK